MAASLLETRTTDGQVTSCGATPRLASFRVGACAQTRGTALAATVAQQHRRIRPPRAAVPPPPPDFYRDGGHMSDSAAVVGLFLGEARTFSMTRRAE